MGGIFLIQEGGKLVKMSEQPYPTEDLLQELLASYPDLLAGDQMNDSAPRRWLLVTREMGVPGEEEGSDRWSLDHLFLDQDAIPTLVEVKRSSDTRIRRELIGQMLDYAANAVVYWPVEQIQAKFERRCEQEQVNPTTALSAHLAEEGEPSEFWQKVKLNLQAGRVRMVFVADEIPVEVRRVVEFLNGQMNPAEVLAVEVKQYVGGGMRSLVPRVLGQTVAAQEKKSGGSSKQEKISEEEFLRTYAEARNQQETVLVRRLIVWSKESGLEPNFKRSAQTTWFPPSIKLNGLPRCPFYVDVSGDIWLQMVTLRDYQPFDNQEKREELRKKLNGLPGVDVPQDRITGYPKIPLAQLTDGPNADKLIETLTWLIGELRSGTSTSADAPPSPERGDTRGNG